MPIGKVGEPAPDFDLPVFDPAEPYNLGLRASLFGYRGEWLVLFFYPADFTFVCPTEIMAFAEHRRAFDQLGARILGCSTDTIHTHRAWAATPREKNGILGLNYPLAADHTGRVAESYGVLVEEDHEALRGLFIVDPTGKLQLATIHASGIGRSTEETLRVLAALQSGGLCPADWSPGRQTLPSPEELLRAA